MSILVDIPSFMEDMHNEKGHLHERVYPAAITLTTK